VLNLSDIFLRMVPHTIFPAERWNNSKLRLGGLQEQRIQLKVFIVITQYHGLS